MVPNLGFKAVGFVSLKIPFPHLSLERLFSSEFSVDCYVSYSPGQHLKVRKSLQYLGKVCRTLTVCPAFIGSRMKPTSVKCCTLNSYLQICWIKISYKWLKCYNKWFKPLDICGKQFNGVPEQLQDKEIWVMNSSSILMWSLHPGMRLCVLNALSKDSLLIPSVARTETNIFVFLYAFCRKENRSFVIYKALPVFTYIIRYY